MPDFARDEMEEMVERWLAANTAAQETGDWRGLADFYTEDATYGWNYGPKEVFMALGRNEIRDVALGEEMGGLGGWTYPYQRVLIDDGVGEVVGFWRQLADVRRPDGSAYEVAGIGGSWFRYAGGFRWSWQRDWFDFGNAAHVFMEMAQAGVLSEGMSARLERAVRQGQLPCHYPIGEAPAGLWD